MGLEILAKVNALTSSPASDTREEVPALEALSASTSPTDLHGAASHTKITDGLEARSQGAAPRPIRLSRPAWIRHR
jgi:hypothetical protein